jgi:hypothetical protein
MTGRSLIVPKSTLAEAARASGLPAVPNVLIIEKEAPARVVYVEAKPPAVPAPRRPAPKPRRENRMTADDLFVDIVYRGSPSIMGAILLYFLLRYGG